MSCTTPRIDASRPGGENIRAGSHLVTPRRAYLHHGIYVGNGKVVHYAGLVRGLRRGTVEEVTLDEFADGRAVLVVTYTQAVFDRDEVIRRARSRVGENRYRLLTNNCEHFCLWCIWGEGRSYQIEALLNGPGRVLRAVLNLVALARAKFPVPPSVPAENAFQR